MNGAKRGALGALEFVLAGAAFRAMCSLARLDAFDMTQSGLPGRDATSASSDFRFQLFLFGGNGYVRA